MGKLTVKEVEKIKREAIRGAYSDGDGLFLQVAKNGHSSWVYIIRVHGTRRHMGLGGCSTVTLADAREARDEAKKLLKTGIDPIIARGAKRQIAASTLSVERACESYIAAQKAKWRTEDQIKQFRQRQRDYVYPIIGHLPIADIKGAEVRQVLSPIWTKINPTASRIRQFMEGVVNWAIHEGVRTDESNPWEVKRLEFAFPFGVHEVVSHPALLFTEAPAFLTELRQQKGVKAKALEFVMLTVVRIGDIVGGGKDHSVPMLWSHVNMSERVWTIPDTKKNKPHEVPLSAPAMRVLAEMQKHRDPATDFVFPGTKRGTVISDATLRYLLRDMGYAGTITTHGMRATFRTWARETTNADKDVVKACMSHAKEEMDEVYHRGSFFDKRRRLMNAWADYLEGTARARLKSVAA